MESHNQAKTSKELSKNGCELAVHGYRHARILPLLNSNEKENEIKLAINSYKKIFKKKPKGFFASRNAYDEQSLKMLSDNGIQYYAENNKLYPEKNQKLWDLTLKPSFFDPENNKWKKTADYVREHNGIITTCWHASSMNPQSIKHYEEFIKYLKQNQVPIKTAEQVIKDLKA